LNNYILSSIFCWITVF